MKERRHRRIALKPVIYGEKAVNGTNAVAYEPLVFSLPIAEKAEIVKDFPKPRQKV